MKKPRVSRRTMVAAAAVSAATLAFAPAWGGGHTTDLKLVPKGFGTHTHANWDGAVGEPDPSGGAQSFYLQKDVPTATPVAAVAQIKGVEGFKATDITGLSWESKSDEHCGAGAPRWNLYTVDGNGDPHTYFLGCAAANHTRPAQEAGTWMSDDYPSGLPGGMATDFQAQNNGNSPGSDETITGLFIVFDEGSDSTPPDYVHIDNISVQGNSFGKIWHSAADNGNTSG